MTDDLGAASISREQAQQLIVTAFADRPGVLGISLNPGPGVWRVRVITNHGEVYDPATIDMLIELEPPLLQQFGSALVDIDYRRLRSRPFEQLVPRNHILIYRR